MIKRSAKEKHGGDDLNTELGLGAAVATALLKRGGWIRFISLLVLIPKVLLLP
ncbi:hypothetical protein ACP4OV_026931 [Aristida adscensionis]